MSRRHLESALVASAMIESGLKTCFRFSRVRFVRYCFPPGYKSTFRQRHRSANEKIYYDDETEQDETALNDLKFDQDSGSDMMSAAFTCTCHGQMDEAMVESAQSRENAAMVASILGEGDCEPPVQVGTRPCKLHMQKFLKRYPWRKLQDDYSVHSVQFSGDGTKLLAGSANTSIRVIQTVNASQRHIPRPSKWTLGMPITAIRFMPPKLYWAVACNSHGEVFSFSPDESGFETLFKEPQQTYTLDISPDGMELATGGVDRTIRIYTLQPGSVIGLPHELRDTSGVDDTVSSYRIQTTIHKNPNNAQAGVDSDGTANKRLRFHFPGGRPNQIVDTTTKPYVLTRCYSLHNEPDAVDQLEAAAYASRDQPVLPLREYVPTSPGVNITEGHSMRIMALRYNPQNSSMLVSAGWDNTVKIWDTRLQSGPVCSIFGPHVASSDGLDIEDNYLLTASWRARSSLEIWDIRSIGARQSKTSVVPSSLPDDGDVNKRKQCGETKPAEVIPISGTIWDQQASKFQGEYPYAARILPNRAIVAAGSGFQEIRVVGRDTFLPIARVPTDSVIQSLDTILEGRYIGAGCASGTIALIGLA